MGRLGQYLRRPLIQAGSSRLSGDQGRAMHFGRDAQHELAAGGFFWRFTDLCAGFEVVIHGFLECRTQLRDVVGMKSHNIADAE